MAEMGGLAERQIAEAIEALTTRDSARAWRVINADSIIDDMQRAIEERAIETIARRQPVAACRRGNAHPASGQLCVRSPFS